MGVVLLLSILFSAFVSFSNAKFVAIAPQSLTAGASHTILLDVSAADSAASYGIRLTSFQDNSAGCFASGIASPGLNSILFQVPPDFTRGPASIQVELGSEPVVQQSIQVVPPAISAYIETDKVLYQPGQLIRGLVLLLDTQLKPVPAVSVELSLVNPQDFKVLKQQIVSDDYGMANFTYQLDSEATIGSWKAQVFAEGINYVADLKVQKYVLPRFEVVVQVPSELPQGRSVVSGKIIAKYSFGKPVQGLVTVSLGSFTPYYMTGSQTPKSLTISLPINGETEFNLPTGPLNWGHFIITATVFEKESGVHQNGTASFNIISSYPTATCVAFEDVVSPLLSNLVQVNFSQPGISDGLWRVSSESNSWVSIADSQVTVQNGVGTFSFSFQQTSTMYGQIPFQLHCLSSSCLGHTVSCYLGSYARSSTGDFLKIRRETLSALQIGETARFAVTTVLQGDSTDPIFFAVSALGEIVHRGIVTDEGGISFPVLSTMSPEAKLFAWKIVGDKVVSASVQFTVEASLQNPGQISFDQATATPGGSVSVTYQSATDARLQLVAIDKSIDFLGGSDPLSSDKLIDGLRKLTESRNPSTPTYGQELPISQYAGLVLITSNTPVSNYSYQEYHWWNDAPVMLAEAADGKNYQATGTVVPTVQEVHVRKFFPETWLWQQLMPDADGTGSLALTVPDTITTWQFRGISLSPSLGIGLDSAQLEVFQPFFVELNLPVSAKRGETLLVSASVYNYLDKELTVTLAMADSPIAQPVDSIVVVHVAANSVAAGLYKIMLVGIGEASITLTAQSALATDVLKRKLTVEPEGEKRQVVKNIFINGPGLFTFSGKPPSTAVDGSAQCKFSAIGDILGPAMAGIDSLIQMPCGCGEQTMVIMGPAIAASRYLGPSSPVSDKARKMLAIGYQRELHYRHTDGSYSAFGMQDPEGSLWLTSFVTRMFALSAEFTFVDNAVLQSAVNYLLANQLPDGSFHNLGQLHHQLMSGGSSTPGCPLTAFVLLSLIDANASASTVIKARKYLESNCAASTDPYTACISAYALRRADSARADSALSNMLSLQISDQDGIHWGEPLPLMQQKDFCFYCGQTSSFAVEMTGYALQTLVLADMVNDASGVARWLAAQRNSAGGFTSTQDTVIGVLALADYAAKLSEQPVDLSISFTGTQETSWAQRMVLKARDVMEEVTLPCGQITANVKGTGQAFGQFVLSYNEAEVYPLNNANLIDVSVSAVFLDPANSSCRHSICISYPKRRNNGNVNGQQPLGMVMVEQELFTGYSADPESLDHLVSHHKYIRRWDVNGAGTSVALYLHGLESSFEDVCMDFTSVQQTPVDNVLRRPAIAYAYYSPHIRGVNYAVPTPSVPSDRLALKLGLGIGLGVGLPALALGSIVLAWQIARNRRQRLATSHHQLSETPTVE